MCRLQAGIKSWIRCLKGDVIEFIDDTDAAASRAGGKPEIKVCGVLVWGRARICVKLG